MTPAPSPRPPRKPLARLSQREEAILLAIAKLRYATRLDIAHLPACSDVSESYLRKILAALAGGKDLQPNQYLCRFPRPQTTPGSLEKVYALGARGREYLTTLLGERVHWWYGPAKTSNHSFSYLLHQLTLTRLVCAAWYWSQQQSAFSLVQVRMSYELARTAPTVTLDTAESQTPVTVIPDAWLCFERSDGKKFPVLLEIDRGTEQHEKFSAHARARIRLIVSGAYERSFGLAAVRIAYATTGLTPEYRNSRLHTMRQWTAAVVNEAITEDNRQAWMGMFCFTSLVYEDIYQDASALFASDVWLRPDALTPVPLFTEDPQPPQGEAHEPDSQAHG
jgi:hypothetical protein